MSDTTCQPAFSAEPTPQPNGDAPAYFQSCRNTSEGGSDTALLMRVMQTRKLPPPLVLTHKMRQDAFQLDHDRALRGNRARAGRIAAEAKMATAAILSRGN
jgi:hypothetical protein